MCRPSTQRRFDTAYSSFAHTTVHLLHSEEQKESLYFLQRVSMRKHASTVLAISSIRLSVRPSVTRWDCAQTRQPRITGSSPSESTILNPNNTTFLCICSSVALLKQLCSDFDEISCLARQQTLHGGRRVAPTDVSVRMNTSAGCQCSSLFTLMQTHLSRFFSVHRTTILSCCPSFTRTSARPSLVVSHGGPSTRWARSAGF